MAELAPAGPYPPGDYPVVIVGSGPGGLQTSYHLSRFGVEHALISSDDAPGGMFRRFPIFQRLITWTKLHAPVERGDPAYEWFDWNSLLGEEPDHRSVLPGLMDGTSYFPSRPEMEAGLRSFVDRAGIDCRYGCEWLSTRRDDQGFVLGTSDGEYRCRVVVFAVGMAEPWKPSIPGLDDVPHYVELKDAKHYADKTVFLIGKRNSGFELADGLLPWARQIVLASPRPARISVLARSTAAARARYLQPYEDHVLGGGNLVLDATIERVERNSDASTVHIRGTTRPGTMTIEADAVIAATGFSVPLGDLRDLGVVTFHQDRLPAQTPYWESASVPGIYFAGAITQGSIGMKKYGIPSNSAAVHGFRYNARLLARHIAEKHMGVSFPRPTLKPEQVVDHLLGKARRGPDLWNQRSYLAQVVEFSPDDGITDAGCVPLAHFVDVTGPDAVAITVETDADGDIHPALYLRRSGTVSEHLLGSDPLHNFESAAHRKAATALLTGLI
ncbi:MAG TPA: NAD(P)-binding domain-containing protein [Actinomycetota bacterium]|nr:NAD(P)-binding domain-containing protein [Actinomycetota bacterium]